MARSRVLVVEDDEEFGELYRSFFDLLHPGNFIGLLARSGEQADAHLGKHPSPPVDAAILDWTLPDTDGLSLLRQIRATPATRDIVVFMVTGNRREEDLDAALRAGADDCIAKPFRNNELFLKLNNHLQRRRKNQKDRGVFELDGLVLDIHRRAVTLHGQVVHLKPKDFDLLTVLLERPNIVHQRSFLADAISSPSDETPVEGIRDHICSLRKALGTWSDRIEARYGHGYVLHTDFPISRS